MLIGICSDSHGRVAAMKTALRRFDAAGVSRIVHCGDIGGQEIFDLLVGREVYFVWGNTDYPSPGLREYLRTVDIPLPGSVPLRLDWAGKRIAVFHGHEPEFGRAIESADLEVDYLLHGHTHQAHDERVNGLRIINPGALHRCRRKTVAVLNLASDDLHFLEVRAD